MNLKQQRFKFTDGSEEIKFIPNNPAGIGLGFASKKIIVDIGFNIKQKDVKPTTRFDLRAAFKHKGHYLDWFLQNYKGFNVQNPILSNSTFREDVSSFSTGLNYLYLINNKDYNLGALRAVLSSANKSSYTFGFGGFGIIMNQSADSLLISNSFVQNPENKIEDFMCFGAGVLAGGAGFLSIGHNFYASIALNAGVGLMYKKVTIDNTINTPNPLLFQLNGSGAIGYMKEKFYLNLTLGLGSYGTDINRNAIEIISHTKAKFAVGYKIFRK